MSNRPKPRGVRSRKATAYLKLVDDINAAVADGRDPDTLRFTMDDLTAAEVRAIIEARREIAGPAPTSPVELFTPKERRFVSLEKGRN